VWQAWRLEAPTLVAVGECTAISDSRPQPGYAFIGVLHNVLGNRRLANQPACQVIRGVEMGKHELLKFTMAALIFH
jgi:hypothetical protein